MGLRAMMMITGNIDGLGIIRRLTLKMIKFKFYYPKKTSLRGFTSFELSRVKIHQQVGPYDM